MVSPENGAGVLVVGGGPAGLATASALTRKGLRVSVVERSDYKDTRIGEHLGPTALHDLRAMGFPEPDGGDAHLCSSGIDAWWGGPTVHRMDYFVHPAGRGFNLSRPLFDQSLAEKCRESGAAILTSARQVRADWKQSRWVVGVHTRDGTGVLQPRFIVDATGRSAAFARARGASVQCEDRQIAVVAVGSCRKDPDPRSGRVVIESAETGWWYFAPLSAGRCVCMFVTDADLFPGPARVPLQPWWTLQVRCTSHVRRHVAQYNHVADPIVRCARSQRLDRFTGIGWCAVGDAAMAFDPLSSRGIAKAVTEGRLAADAIAAHLSGDRTALHDYGTVLEEEYRDYRLTRARYYALERRWPRSEFWRRRYAAAEADRS